MTRTVSVVVIGVVRARCGLGDHEKRVRVGHSQPIGNASSHLDGVCPKHGTETPKQIEFWIWSRLFRALSVDAVKRQTISRGHGLVFEFFGDTLLKNIYVKSFGGDQSKEWSSGGACGVVLRKSNLTIKKCVILSEQGTGVAVDNDSKTAPCRRLAIEECKVGPCGRHCVFLDRCAEIISKKASRSRLWKRYP